MNRFTNKHHRDLPHLSKRSMELLKKIKDLMDKQNVKRIHMETTKDKSKKEN